MLGLAGFVVLIFGSVLGAVEANRTWNVGIAILAFLGSLVGGIMLLMIPFVGWFLGALPGFALQRHAQAVRFLALANEEDELTVGLMDE